eukprot:EG_transcript_31701
MQNLLRVIDMHQEDAAAHDVVCMCSTLLALLDMTVDAAGPDLRLAWAGGTESARGRRRRDRIIIQRCGSTLFLDQASVPFQSAPVSLATQLRRSCVEPSNPCVQAYLLGRVQLMGLRLLVASLPDAVMPDGRLMEIKLAHQLTPRDAVRQAAGWVGETPKCTMSQKLKQAKNSAVLERNGPDLGSPWSYGEIKTLLDIWEI